MGKPTTLVSASANPISAANELGIQMQVAALQRVRTTQRAGRSQRVDVGRFPLQSALAKAVEQLSAALYPRRLGSFAGAACQENDFVAARIRSGLALLRHEIAAEFAYWEGEAAQPFDADQADDVVRFFATTLADLRCAIDLDVEAAFLGDPAARSVDEILICYPGAIAVRYHRIAHQLYALGAPIVARIISEIANAATGIDIHPGATIGPSFFIDHGTGVVIGETAIIGARVKLYQHVTLGARAPLGLMTTGPRDRYARHPIIEDDVVIYAGATILGRVTIGEGSTIGGNVWLLDDVPPNSMVVQPAARILSSEPETGFHAAPMGRGH